MASPSVEMKVEGGGGGGRRAGGDPTREILRMNKALRKSENTRKNSLSKTFLVHLGAGRERRRRDPSTIASIPSRYQVFYHHSTQAKGFSSQSSRFVEHLNIVSSSFALSSESLPVLSLFVLKDESPGPGSYTDPVSSLNAHPNSSSTAGSGGFASKVRIYTYVMH